MIFVITVSLVSIGFLTVAYLKFKKREDEMAEWMKEDLIWKENLLKDLKEIVEG